MDTYGPEAAQLRHFEVRRKILEIELQVSTKECEEYLKLLLGEGDATTSMHPGSQRSQPRAVVCNFTLV